MDFKVSICPQEVRTMWIRSFQKCDWDKLWEALSYVPWPVVSSFDDIDDQWETFHSLLLDSLNAFSPLRKVSSRRAKRPTPWFTDCIATKIKEKIRAKRIAAHSSNERDREVYCKFKNEPKVIICEAKAAYLWNAMSQARANPKLAACMWRCVNDVIVCDISQNTEFPRGYH